MNKKFAEHVTSIAFHMSLSKSMIVTMTQIADKQYSGGIYRALGGYETFLPSAKALISRGLVEWHDTTKLTSKKKYAYSLTEAGEHVFELLKLAGLVETIRAVREAA